MELKLKAAWTQGLKLRDEASKLWDEGSKLRADCDKLWAEGDKLRADCDKLWAEGSKLRAEADKFWAEGDKIWAEAIIEAYGNVTLSWSWHTKHGECTLENGDVYDETTIVQQETA